MAFAFSFFVAFAIALATPYASIIYYPDLYSWDYDYELSGSWIVQKVEEVIEIGGIPVSGIIYLLIFIIMVAKVLF